MCFFIFLLNDKFKTFFFFFSSRRRHTRLQGDWSSDVCSSDLAVGICCAKVGEAEVMAESGIRNMLITTEVVGPEKIGRLLGVLERAPETLVVVDNPANVRELGQAMAAAGKVLNVL